MRGIALVLLSHLHADHVGGLAGALRGRPVGAIAVGPVREPAWALRDIARLAAAAGVPLVALAAGRRLACPASPSTCWGRRTRPPTSTRTTARR